MPIANPTQDPKARRVHVLATLYFAAGGTATVQQLQREISRLGVMAPSADQIRGDLSWLKEQGFVLLRDDLAMMTERGNDVARGDAPWPGE